MIILLNKFARKNIVFNDQKFMNIKEISLKICLFYESNKSFC